ncbi:MAG: tRNA dihydrouridine synthase DusB [Caldilineaceae bacterium]|nr:tRNA dihydrouridine synthase DusB [Caldilineaceae bacterium]
MKMTPSHHQPASGKAAGHRGILSEPAFFVRDIPVYGRLILAPMAGFSDLPYRSLCYDYGSAMSYTEFASAEAINQGSNERTDRILSYMPHERPMVFQIFGHSVNQLVEAAQRIEPRGPSIIDINMGCSVEKVSSKGAGAALLREPKKVGAIFRALTNTLSVPVTGKIRLGWDDNSRNYLTIVQEMVENGASLVAVHGRTKDQGYSGQADWDAIAEVVEAVDVPVIGNGDVEVVADAGRLMTHTGCTAVMIGRGAIGHPWFFRGQDRHEVNIVEKAVFITSHFERMRSFYGERQALIFMRKHIVKYLKGYVGIKDLYVGLVQVESPQQFYELMNAVVERLAQVSLPQSIHYKTAPLSVAAD